MTTKNITTARICFAWAKFIALIFIVGFVGIILLDLMVGVPGISESVGGGPKTNL